MKSDTYKVETKKKTTIIIMGVGAVLALCVFAFIAEALAVRY